MMPFSVVMHWQYIAYVALYAASPHHWHCLAASLAAALAQQELQQSTHTGTCLCLLRRGNSWEPQRAASLFLPPDAVKTRRSIEETPPPLRFAPETASTYATHAACALSCAGSPYYPTAQLPCTRPSPIPRGATDPPTERIFDRQRHREREPEPQGAVQGADHRRRRRRGRVSFAHVEFFTRAPAAALRQSDAAQWARLRGARRQLVIRYDQLILVGSELPPLEASSRLRRKRRVRAAIGVCLPAALSTACADPNLQSCTTSCTRGSRSPVLTRSRLHQTPDLARGALVLDAALFALCHALVAMRAVLTGVVGPRRRSAQMNSGGACADKERCVRRLQAGGAAALVMALFRELQHRERQSEARSRACLTSSTPARGCSCCTAAGLAEFCVEEAAAAGAAAAGSGCGSGGWRERRRGSGDGNRSSTAVKWFTLYLDTSH
ncbi:hypothetical protein GGX14DRAFT_409053 [Mycena pura]|uniref:Uncharacterized protein n=1 Tax=Mycena pura TaxID=153505 RepID=A0AAD6UJZ3_9AGAR|nr:hypothetical protein GGX14DRAFT_409053 [Mycena pura]